MKIPGFVRHMVQRLRMQGHAAYVVGGAVRDMCMGRVAADWDVATSAHPEEIAAVFHDTRLFSLKHGTVSLMERGRCYEVTSFRGQGRRDVETDLAHRDFTINAMAYDPVGRELLDPFEGRRDIGRKLVRCVGRPGDRFREDPLRMLRAARLSAELGFRMDPGTLEEVTLLGRELARVAEERVRDELMKILLSPRPSRGFQIMKKTGLLKVVVPELLEGVGRRQNPEHHHYTIYRHVMEATDRVEPDPVLRLTALLHDIAKPRVRERIGGKYRFYGHAEEGALIAREIMGRLKFNNETTDQVVHLIENHMRDLDYQPNWSEGAVRRLVRRIGTEHMDRYLAFRRADLWAHGMTGNRGHRFLEFAGRIRVLMARPFARGKRELAIDGHGVMEILNLSSGPEVGRVLNFLLERVTDDPDLNRKESLVAMVEEMKRE